MVGNGNQYLVRTVQSNGYKSTGKRQLSFCGWQAKDGSQCPPNGRRYHGATTRARTAHNQLIEYAASQLEKRQRNTDRDAKINAAAQSTTENGGNDDLHSA